MARSDEVASSDMPAAGVKAAAAPAIAGLRILYAVDSLFPGSGGAEAQALKLAARLREHGANVRFVTPRVLPEQPLHELYDGFELERIDYPHVRWLGSLVLMLNFARYLKRQRGQVDVLHVHITHLLAASAGFARGASGIPVVTKISGFYEFQGGVLDPTRRFRPLNTLLRLGLKRVDWFQTISEQTRRKLLDAGTPAGKILFVPNGIDTRVTVSSPPDDGVLRIGFCGRLREVKGAHVLLDAFAMLRKRHPERAIRLVVAGSGTAGEALHAQADELGIADGIDWLGRIDRTLPFFASIDIFVQPSFAEGLPNTVMEAMLCSRPVVASDIGGNSDLLGKGGGVLVPAGDAVALASAIDVLLDNPAERERHGAAGRRIIEEHYDMDSVLDQLVPVYRG